MTIKYYLAATFLFIQSLVFAQTTYIWTGSINSNFSTAGNWNPVRQISRANDRLIFNNGQNNNITGVNQITFAQILITGNTQVKLTPGTGNPRIIFIQSLSDNSGGNPDPGGNLADLKYNECKIEDPVNDIATLKYSDYSSDNANSINNIADIKYSEYKTDPVNGMGDLKYGETLDNPYDNNFFIEAGSVLRISANDPSLSIFLKSNTRAEIYGNLIMEGSVQNTINSQDPYTIYFMEGSKTVQNCPGNLFNTTGAVNTAVFKNGSVLEINNPAALNPFALQIPDSKVIFEDGSKFRLNSPNSNALRLSGRNYADLEINTVINYSEIITSDCTIKDLIVKPGASLTVNNLNNSSLLPCLNIKGNLQLDGTLIFPENSSRNINIKFNGNNVQNISGSGFVDLNTSINSIYLSNDISLSRNIDASCNVIHTAGNISCSQYQFTIFGSFISPSALPVGFNIQSGHSSIIRNEGTALTEGKQENRNGSKPVNESISRVNNTPEEFYLNQNYPNPFNPVTTIEFGIPEESFVTLKIYNSAGMEISELANSNFKAGKNRIDFNGNNIASGVYLYKIIFNNNNKIISFVKKMILTK